MKIHRVPVHCRPLIVTGMKNSGKSLVIGLLEAFSSLQTTFKDFRIEHLLQLQHYDLIDKELAASLVRYNVDFNFFDLQMGRGLNFRIGDETSIWRMINPAESFALIAGSSGTTATKLNKTNDELSVFDCHNGLLYLEFISNALPNSAMVNVTRCPISVIFSWVRDGLFEDVNLKRPRSQILQINHHGTPVPLFASSWPDDFLRMGGPDRAVRIFTELHSQETLRKKKLREYKINYLDLVFEDILVDPTKTIASLQAFLNTNSLPSLAKIFGRERVPRITASDERDRKLLAIRERLSPKYQRQFDDFLNATQHN